MRMNDCGAVVHEEWFRSARIRTETRLDAWVVMPNHVHGIVAIIGGVGAGGRGRMLVGARGVRPSDDLETGKGTRRVPLRRARSLASFIAGFKSASTKRIREMWRLEEGTVWQRNYYEHIIRDDTELNKICEYISTNPLRWMSDPENLESHATQSEDQLPWECNRPVPFVGAHSARPSGCSVPRRPFWGAIRYRPVGDLREDFLTGGTSFSSRATAFCTSLASSASLVEGSKSRYWR